MYRSNRSFNVPPPGIPRAFYTFVVPGRREFDYQSLPGCGKFDPHAKGVGNLNRSLDFMWNLWALCTWRATMAGTQCASNVDCILTDWQVNEVNIVTLTDFLPDFFFQATCVTEWIKHLSHVFTELKIHHYIHHYISVNKELPTSIGWVIPLHWSSLTICTGFVAIQHANLFTIIWLKQGYIKINSWFP